VAAESSLLTRSQLCSHISWYNTAGVLLQVAILPERDEGTGTRQDYLVNRDDQKNEGQFGGKQLHGNRETVVE